MAAIPTALLIGACGAKTGTTVQSGSSAIPVSASYSSGSDSAFLAIVHEKSDLPDSATVNGPALTLGHDICKTLNSGISFTVIADKVINSSSTLTGNEEGVLLGAAVVTFCPSYTADMRAYVAANSWT